MSSILDLKRWERVTYAVAGQDGGTDSEITMELRRLRRSESKPLRKALITIFKQFEKASDENLTTAEKGEIVEAVYEQAGEEQIRQWFSTWVRSVGNLAVDGKAITTGQELFDEVADDGMISYVLLKLADLAKLTTPEKNASASLSTSSPAPEAESSASRAPSTGSEAWPPPSTATETLPEPYPCSAPDEEEREPTPVAR